MLNSLSKFTVFVVLCCAVTASAVEHRELKAFPAAKDGMERFVIVLPHIQQPPSRRNLRSEGI